ncbi:hypothetical protein SAMN04489732_101449 [Amycolatopsis saalfeldensis]|uniref:Uncharacterized protein n=1 Tax=Amycolatopsis saalfeldensis TaxID=394193 RepID=A0A1H8QRL3_9PSEU|nr:hypothetical protein SAMN04489732_101449 [Amycolatopsis saalfeldensis]
MGGGGFFDRAAAYGERSAARERRWLLVARALRWPVLGVAVVVGLVAWWLSDWQMWPWLGGLGAVLLLGLTGTARRVGLAWTLAVTLAVVDVWLLTYVEPWWWLLLVGVAVLGAGVVAAVRLRLRERRAQTVAAVVVGVVLVVLSVVMLAVNAAERDRQAQAVLDQEHQNAVARILPRTPASMVDLLAEKIAFPTPDAVATACFYFAPPAQAQLARSRGVADCPAAIRSLAALVSAAGDYVNNLWLPGQATQDGPGGTLLVDACHLTFDRLTDDTPHPNPGPQLGLLTLQQQQGQGHLIVVYQPCR